MANLKVDFSALHRCVEQMGAREVDFTLKITQRPIEPIDITLRNGLEISLNEISYESGLLSYEGRQVLLYIKDHGKDVAAALKDGRSGRRFHVSDCKTLEEMRKKKRFERYFVTNDLSGEFEITGYDPVINQKLSGKTRLRVCQNCLKKLNYKGFFEGSDEPRNVIWNNFSISEFFRYYSSYFKYLPYHAEHDDAQYTEDWAKISGRIKVQKGFCCEQCGVNLKNHKNLLHVHHINGHKSNNRLDNLKVLCIDCHRKQPMHDHMFVSREQMRQINQQRRKQGICFNGTWEQVLKVADPAVEGVIRLCKRKSIPVPEVSYELSDETGVVVGEAALAWEDSKVAVVLSLQDKAQLEKTKWRIWTQIEVLDRPEHFKNQITGSNVINALHELEL